MYVDKVVYSLGQPGWRWVNVRPGTVYNNNPMRINGRWYRWATNISDPRDNDRISSVRADARRFIEDGLKKGGVLCHAANPEGWNNTKTTYELNMLAILLPCTAEGNFTVQRSFN